MEDQALVQLANEVLSKLPGSLRVTSWREINSQIFVALYEGLFAEALPDVIRLPNCREDEVHNVQAVIDTLSLDILNTSLSHLSGEAIVAKNQQAVKSLLEVFEWLFEYILEKIGSESSSDVAGEVTFDDPDLVTPEVIDSILERELGRNHSSIRSKSRNGDKSGSRGKLEGNSTTELIALGNNSRNISKVTSPDRTEDLIALGDSRQYNSQPHGLTDSKTSWRKFPKGQKQTVRSKNTRNTSQPLSAGELSSIVVHDSSMNNERDQSRNSRVAQGISLSGLGRADFAEERHAVGSGPGDRLSSPISNGFNGDLSSGPISTDVSDRGYIPDQSKDLSVSPALGAKETTADLIRESESLEKRLGLSSGENLSSVHFNSRVSAGLESSLASSSAYPKPVVTEPGSKSSEFDQIGIRPRSLITPTDGYRDNHASSLPLDPQYHSFTHHLYHHYGGDKAQLPSRTQPSKPQASSSTQVTPGRFLEEARPKNTGDTVETQTKAGDSKRAGGASQSCSYDNLRHILQDTMNMSEQALRSSPFRQNKPAGATQDRKADLTDDELTKRLRETLQKLHTSEESATDRSGTLEKSRSHKKQENLHPKTQSILSPSKGKKQTVTNRVPRKVSFLTAKSDRRKNYTSPRIRERSLSPDSSVSSPGVQPRRSYDQTTKYKNTQSASSRALSSEGNSRAFQRKNPREGKTVKAQTAAGRMTAQQMDKFAETASQYFRKYYGGEETADKEDCYYHSDGGVQYTDLGVDSSPEADYGDFQADLEAYKSELILRSKQVRFDDILDDSAPGEMGGIRRKLANEEKRTRFRSEFLKDVYDQELMDYEEGMREQMSKLKSQCKDISKEYRKKVKHSPATTKYKPAKKSTASRSVLIPKSKAHNRTTPARRNRKRSATASATASPAAGRDTVKFYDNEILPWLLEEFPFLHISSEALHDMWRKSAKQMEILSKTDQYVKAKKNRAQKQIEEAEYKQNLLAEIAKKELSHNERMRELDERRKQQQSVKATLREKRQQHARVRKYYDDFHVRMRSKMLKKRTREEMVFKKLFEEGLKTQRDRIRDLRKYSQDQRQERSKKQKDELQSIENFYKDRFALLGEALEKEREERLLTSKAQQKIVNSMNREFRKKTEKEIETIQDHIFRDDDDEYFRQLDADRLRQELHLARYKARV